ncbi:MAG: D-alanyl-D-alanine carboxypeptidase [Candidatus Omnitrophica bacterium]|nr:D-alanyl-D-alanine carboxypeptidase [Candidatus Omnitrophota bacterium]MBU1933576.1 D-alanyl-D-alanine carboxypeptidase [Candidatus Omnitrophota bacterium]
MFRRFAIISILFITVAAFAQNTLPLTADSAVLMNPMTKKLIYAKNEHKKLAPASTTKIMTAIVVLRNRSLDDKVTVSKYASSMEPSKVYIKEGEVYSVRDLLKAVLLNSGNDASVVLAEAVAGSEKDFSSMMTEVAKSIGAEDTNFRNSSGLPAKNQYSTAYDLALIVREAMKYKYFVEIMKMKKAEIEEFNSGRKIKLKNHNKSLWKDTPYSIFGKTGYTKNAGHCFAGYIRYSWWKKVIVVTLKGSKLWDDLEILAASY